VVKPNVFAELQDGNIEINQIAERILNKFAETIKYINHLQVIDALLISLPGLHTQQFFSTL
jgi:hypothetical protein